MRTQLLSRIFSLYALAPRTIFASGSASAAALLCLALAGSAWCRFQNNPAAPAVSAPSVATVPDEPVAVESRKPVSAEPAVSSRPANIRVDKTLVLINVTVTDPLNRFVTGLEKEHFRLYEDKMEQTITQFSSEDAPLSIGLVFDTSGSMGSKLQKSRQAATEFFKTANPADEFFLVQFNDRPQLVVPFTTDTDKIQSALTFTQSKGRTALLDGVYLAMHEMKKAHNPRKAILIISDGGDNSSRYTETEIKNAVREADVQIFAIGIFESIANRGRTPEEAAGPGLLNELAEQTGGREYAVENVTELPDIAAKIGIELRNEYILGYTPKNRERDGKYRRVQVKLNQPRGLPPLKAYFRLGYYAPTQ
ncbi:MAG: VWA domain-containing protein [Acidobacteriaceae bacterium]|nr:VWA domain-containing protein [Acidobacteriaceae bacterium]MBV9778715.1 VWA domain-containing protein [Acidobacteriaceae bacterium]